MQENNQAWNQPRQGYKPGVQRPQYPGMPQVKGNIQTKPWLTREEKQEAKRLAEEAKFSYIGYQVVRREFVSHLYDPAMTIRGNSITFNNSCISKLEDATYVQFLINPEERKLAIRPCDEGARDAVRWCTLRGDKRKSREITCRPFTERLYELMGWEALYRYKLQGMRITYQGESLYLFDLSSNEAFLPQGRDPATGKKVRSKAVLPQDWMDSFGMNVDEHTASTQIDQNSGFIAPENAVDEPDNGQISMMDEQAEVAQ